MFFSREKYKVSDNDGFHLLEKDESVWCKDENDSLEGASHQIDTANVPTQRLRRLLSWAMTKEKGTVKNHNIWEIAK